MLVSDLTLPCLCSVDHAPPPADPGLNVRGVCAAGTDVLTEESRSAPSSSLKAATLVLTEEEKQLLAAEGISLPTDMPLTKVGCTLSLRAVMYVTVTCEL